MLFLPLHRHTPVLLLLLFSLFSSPLFAQVRCGTVPYNKKLKNDKKIIDNDVYFENWLKKKSLNRKKGLESNRTQTSTYQIPVVVHIIHNGEPVGVGKNLSVDQIVSQIDALNKDFQRLNNDVGKTPSEFEGVAGKMDIEFILAKQNTTGLPTNGITRRAGTKSTWDFHDFDQLKSLSYWNSNDYLNIWVADINLYLGYTQFPVSDLEGIEGSPDVAETDGIVVDYESFGSDDDGDFTLDPRYNKGRTLTHEMGHFFGLRHIWGDENSCSDNDYVVDTPPQFNETETCPSSPLESCSTHTMYQNYLDYTFDECMNLFTLGQVERMTTVLENSVRRFTLQNSHGLQEPAPVENDLGISSITKPQVISCSSIVPSIVIKNYGTNKVTSMKVQLKINGVLLGILDLLVDLDPQEEMTVNFSKQQLIKGLSSFTYDIQQTNGDADGNSFNNIVSINTINFEPETTPFARIPFRENFEADFEKNWTFINPHNGKNWKADTIKDNSVIVFDAFNNSNIGDDAWLISPLIDFSNTSKASMFFDLSYAVNKNRNTHETLMILGTSGCETAFDLSFYNEAGASLSDIDSTGSWKPSQSEHWSREFVNLNELAGRDQSRIAFVVTNGHGNKLYLDNIEFFTSDEPFQPNVNEPFLIYNYKGKGAEDFSIKFNLESQQNVHVEVVDIMGRPIFSDTLTDILNETYPVAMDGVAAGIYIIRLRTQQLNYTARVFME